MAAELTRIALGYAVLGGAAEMHRNGLVLHRDLSFDEFRDLADGLQVLESGIQWVLGDLFNYGERSFGEEYADASAATGYTYQSLANFQWVAGAVDFSRRRENLRFSHHAEVASLPPSEQDSFLELAEVNHWSVQTLREEVKKSKARATIAPSRERKADVTNVTTPPASEEADDGQDDLLKELESSNAEHARKDSIIESLTTDDKDREIRKLCAQNAQLSARIDGLLKEKRMAVDQAQYGEKTLRAIRKALGVEKDRDILDAVAALKRKVA